MFSLDFVTLLTWQNVPQAGKVRDSAAHPWGWRSCDLSGGRRDALRLTQEHQREGGSGQEADQDGAGAAKRHGARANLPPGRVLGVNRRVCLDVGEPEGGGAESQGCPLNSCSPFLTTRPGPSRPPCSPEWPHAVRPVVCQCHRWDSKDAELEGPGRLPLPFSPPGRQVLDVD